MATGYSHPKVVDSASSTRSKLGEFMEHGGRWKGHKCFCRGICMFHADLRLDEVKERDTCSANSPQHPADGSLYCTELGTAWCFNTFTRTKFKKNFEFFLMNERYFVCELSNSFKSSGFTKFYKEDKNFIGFLEKFWITLRKTKLWTTTRGFLHI